MKIIQDGCTSGDDTMVENVWDKLATEWAGKEDWIRARNMISTLADKYQFVTFALDRVKLSAVYRKEKGKGMKKRLKTRHRVNWEAADTPSTLVQAGQLYNHVVTMKWQANGSIVNTLWDGCTEGELAKHKRPCTRGGKKKIASPITKIDDFVRHVHREHNQEADHWANIGAQELRKIVLADLIIRRHGRR